jgi:glycosyltransferase involved in cell wall biosynthesis
LKLFALTFGGPETPSTHFRIHQYRQAFLEHGVQIEHALAKEFEDFERLAEYDVVLLQKTLLSRSKIKRIAKHAKVLIYDADDRIWMRAGKPYGLVTRTKLQRRLACTVGSADLCIAANGVIAADQRAAGARRVETLPMSVDTNLWNTEGRQPVAGQLTVGWSGSPGNLVFLEPLVPVMSELLEIYPQLRFSVHCGQRPSFEGLEFTHIPYEPGREPDAVRTFDIGLLPLPDDAFVHGKSPIKALQYYACGAVVVGQDVGATAELLEHDVCALTVNAKRSWKSSLSRLIEDEALRVRLAEAGQDRIQAKHSMTAVVDRYLSLLRSAL